MTPHERVTFDAALDGEEPGTCPVCDGGEGVPCEDECALILETAARREVVRRLYETARKAIRFARCYRVLSEFGGDPRVEPCLEAAREARREIARLRRAEAA